MTMNIRNFIRLFPKTDKAKLESVAIAIVFTFLVVFVTVHLLYNSYNATALDLGLFTQTLKYTLQGDFLYTTIDQSSFLADHFSPILVLLVPIYWLFPFVQTLLVIQAIALGLSAFLAYILARSYGFSHRKSLAIEVLFCLNPLIWGLALFDFHPIALAMPTLLLMLIGMVNKKQALFYTGFILSLMTKETIIITLGVFGFVLFISNYVKKREVNKQYLIIFLTSLFAYGIAILVSVIASGWEFPKMLEYTSVRYSYIDQPILPAITSAVYTFLSPESIFMLVAYLLPFGLLPIFSLEWAAPGLFILLTNMFATYAGQRYEFHQYAAPALPFLYIAFLHTLSKVRDNQGLQLALRRLTPRFTVYFFEGLLLVALLFNISPASRFWDAELPNGHDRATDEVIALIPDGATVTTHYSIFPHICDRTEVYLPHWVSAAIVYDEDIIWGYPERYTEYVVVDWTKRQMYITGKYWEEEIMTQIDKRYDSVIEIDNVELYKLRQD